MAVDALIVIFSRWLHVTFACLVVGGVFFIRVLFPIGMKAIDSAAAQTAFLKTRRVFKMLVHTSILILLLSGTYNAYRNWHGYTAAGPGVGHGVFGLHLLLALVAFGIGLWLLAGAEPPVNHRKWAMINLIILFLTVAAASTLKYVREHPKSRPITEQSPATMPAM